MPAVRFTQNIQRHLTCPPMTVSGTTVRQVLDGYFEHHPQARGYVLDDQQRLRHHMAIFIDGTQVLDRDGLTDAVPAHATLDIIQSLSGGCSLRGQSLSGGC